MAFKVKTDTPMGTAGRKETLLEGGGGHVN